MLVGICLILALIFHIEYRIRLRLRSRDCADDPVALHELREIECRRQLDRIGRGEFAIVTFIYEVVCVRAFQGVYCDWFQDRLLLVWDKSLV